MYSKYLALKSIISDLEKQCGFSLNECAKNFAIVLSKDDNTKVCIMPRELVDALDDLELEILQEFNKEYTPIDINKVKLVYVE